MTVHAALLSGPETSDRAAAGFDTATAAAPDLHHFSARQLWQVLRRHKLIVSSIVAISVVTVLVMQLLTSPIYEAVATVQVELNDSSGANQAEVAARSQQRVANESRIYRSRALAAQVVHDLDLVHDKRFKDSNGLGPERATLQATSRLIGMTYVSGNNESDFIDIAVRSSSPELSTRIANQFVESLQALRQSRRQVRRDQIGDALDVERRRLAEEVEEAERQVAAYRAQTGMLVGAGGSEDYAQINRITVEAASAAALRAAAGARAAEVSRAVSHRSLAGATSVLFQQQQRQYDDLLRKRSELATVYGSRHPDMQRVEAQLRDVSINMEREQANVLKAEASRVAADAARERGMAQGEAAAAASRASQLEGHVRALTGKAYANTSNLVDLAALERKAEVARQAFLLTAQKAQEVRAELETRSVNSSLASAAAVPDQPIAPKPLRATLAALCGSLVLALLVVFGIELFDNKLRTADQLRRLFGLRTFAMVPELPTEAVISAEDNPIIRDPESLYAEVARTLGAEVADLAVPGRVQTILVTSPLPGDGKSTVAITLVAAAASMGRRAIVVDLDLRRPSPSILNEVQNCLNTPDLVDYLVGNVAMDKLLPAPVNPGEREAPSYKPVVLSTRGPVHNPASLIREGQMKRLFADLRERYDLIVINAPAVLAVRDARTLTDLADHTLMVVRWGYTTIEQMHASMQVMSNKVHAAVINKVDYVEHARRGYVDAVQFYMDSAAYYRGSIPRRGAFEGIKKLFGSFRWRQV